MLRHPASTAIHFHSANCEPSPSPKQCVNDGVLTAKLRSRLKMDPVTRAYVIQVETFNDTVILSGYVELATVRTRTLQIAHEITGDRIVKDALEVREA